MRATSAADAVAGTASAAATVNAAGGEFEIDIRQGQDDAAFEVGAGQLHPPPDVRQAQGKNVGATAAVADAWILLAIVGVDAIGPVMLVIEQEMAAFRQHEAGEVGLDADRVGTAAAFGSPGWVGGQSAEQDAEQLAGPHGAVAWGFAAHERLSGGERVGAPS